MKREAKFTQTFRHWLMVNPMHSAAFELKQTVSDRLPFKDVKPHQIDGLLAVKKNQLLYKLPDDSRGVKPFDMVLLAQSGAFVVIKYPHEFVLIDVEMFVEEAQWSIEKSLTSKRASEIAEIHVKL
jgi:hypothetical protein